MSVSGAQRKEWSSCSNSRGAWNVDVKTMKKIV